MKTIFYTSLLIQAFLVPSSDGYSQAKPIAQHAYSQSVSSNSGDSNREAGTFRTMESVRYGMLDGYKGVVVKVEQPVCAGQSGSISLLNPSGEAWKYRVIEKNGNLISEGDRALKWPLGDSVFTNN